LPSVVWCPTTYREGGEGGDTRERCPQQRTPERDAIGSHGRPGFNTSNINHELCHHTGDVTYGRDSTPATS
jgi:hypothetical protein